ncbi:LamG-like jellyroll fold domain-containing protein [Maridesulfovibrio sp.]|uniref:LamG-like jellyroll fold domain-containing protein n=1 Tax=Maridesulfovibrio sp. TaxID=2795000 RepID=UPI0029C9F59B|nr:LamG-like jellyroll fold domain-containing protein [Maridesulfovibrio sp.]
MTVVSSGNTITFAGDGVQNLFDFNFRIFSTEDLCAVVRDSEGTEKKLVHGTDFKLIFGIGMDSGKVQYPVSGDPLSVGESITLYREISYTQELELVENDAFSVQLLNEAFDRGVMRDQQLQEQMDRALKYEISTSAEERLSPQELIKNISSARDEAVAAGDEAVSAENTVREMSAAAQLASEIAQSAQSEAEAARDAAVKIAVGDLAELRSPVPVLSGPVEAPEGTTVLIEISDHVDDDLTSYDVNVFGFGSAIISGSTISWKLGITEADTPKIMEVIRRSRGELQSDIATYELQVKYIPVQAGPTMAFADSEAGYPGATVDADGVHAPAHSVGADNTNQIVSAQPEVTQTSGNLNIFNPRLDGFDTQEPVEVGDIIFADTGQGTVASVSGNTTENFGQDANAYVCLGFTAEVSSYDIVEIDVAEVVGTGAVGVQCAFYNDDGATPWASYPVGDPANTSGWSSTKNINTAGKVTFDLTDTTNFTVGNDYWLLFKVSTPSNDNYLKLRSGPSGIAPFFGSTADADSGGLPQTSTFIWASIDGEESTDTTRSVSLTEALPSVPAVAVKKSNATLKVGAGVEGESLGPEKSLTLKGRRALPYMTARTTEGFKVSYEFGSSYDPVWADWNIADGDPATGPQSYDGNMDNSFPVFLFSGPFTDPVTSLDLAPFGLTPDALMLSRMPSQFTFHGWNGLSWDLLHSVTGATWSNAETQNFAFENTTVYPKYRLVVLDINPESTEASTHWCQIGECSLLYDEFSTTTAIVVEGEHATEIYTEGGIHNNLIVDGQDIKISSASESVAEGDTANLAQPFGDDSCVASYTFDGTLDSLGNVAPTLLCGSVAYEDGVFGQAANLTYPLNPEYLIDGPTIDLAAGCAISTRYKTGGSANKQYFFFENDSGTQYLLGLQGATASPGGWARFFGSDIPEMSWIFPLQDGEWHHIVYNIEATDIVVYVAGAEVYRAAMSAVGPTIRDSCKLIRLGQLNATTPFDQVRIFNRTLTTDEINALYVERGDITITTVTPEVELPAVPESVSIPDRCTLSPDSYSYALDGSDLKITGAEITLEDDPALKRLALAVSGADGLTFKSGKIYIKEKP